MFRCHTVDPFPLLLRGSSRYTRQAKKVVSAGGKLIIVHAPNESLNQFSECFWSRHANQDIWFSDCLENIFEQGVEFTCHRIQGKVDVTECFEEGCSHGEELLDFITQSDCRESDAEVRAMCLQVLRKLVMLMEIATR